MGNSYSTPYTGPVGHVDLAERRRIVEAVVGVVAWSRDGGWGYCDCPGMQFHTNKDGRRDCRVYAGEDAGRGRTGGTLPPSVTCLHTSCAAAVEEASHRIRSLIGKAKVAAAPKNPTGPAGPVRSSTRDTLAHNPATRTVRTPVMKFSKEGASSVRTVRTDISRPYALHAHAGAHACMPGISAGHPSEPSTGVAPAAATEPPKQQPQASAPMPERPSPGGDLGYACIGGVWKWATRAEWEEDLRKNPPKPL